MGWSYLPVVLNSIFKIYHTNNAVILLYIYDIVSKNHNNKVEQICSCSRWNAFLHLNQVDWRGLAPSISNVLIPISIGKNRPKKEITLSFEDHCELRSQSTSFLLWVQVFSHITRLFSTSVNKCLKNRIISSKHPIFIPVKILKIPRIFTRIWVVQVLVKSDESLSGISFHPIMAVAF